MALPDWQQTINNAFLAEGKDPYFTGNEAVTPWDAGGTSAMQSIVNGTYNVNDYGSSSGGSAMTGGSGLVNPFTANTTTTNNFTPKAGNYGGSFMPPGQMQTADAVTGGAQTPGTSVTTPTTPAAPTGPQKIDFSKFQFTPGTATVDPTTGKYYQANYDRTPTEGDSSWGNVTGYTETDGSGAVGSQFQTYDAQGNPTVNGVQKKDPYIQNFLTALAGAVSMGVAGTAMAGAGAAGVGEGAITAGLGNGLAGTSLELGMGAAEGGYAGFVAETTAANAVMEAGLTGTAAEAAKTTATEVAKKAIESGATKAVVDAAVKAAVATVVSTVAGGGGSGGGTGGGNTLGGLDLGNIIKIIAGLDDKKKQEGASSDMLKWMTGQQDKIDKLYAPGSDEYNYLLQSMERKDAAAGRNSQYGPRSVDLAAKIAQVKADNTAKLTNGLAGNYSAAINQNASAGAGVSSALGQLFSGGGSASSIVRNLSSILSNIGGTGKEIDLGGGIKIGADGSVNVSNGTDRVPTTTQEIDDMINGIGFD